MSCAPLFPLCKTYFDVFGFKEDSLAFTVSDHCNQYLHCQLSWIKLVGSLKTYLGNSYFAPAQKCILGDGDLIRKRIKDYGLLISTDAHTHTKLILAYTHTKKKGKLKKKAYKTHSFISSSFELILSWKTEKWNQTP